MLKIIVEGYAKEGDNLADGPEIIYKEFYWPVAPRVGENIDLALEGGCAPMREEVVDVVHVFSENLIEVHFSASRKDLGIYVQDFGFQEE